MKRSGKFYRKNERDVMESLGFKPTPNSGSGWLVKEDGQNENAICQLKSTDATSIRIDQKDIEKLEYNALVSHKLPVFAIQFLNTNEVFLVIRPENLSDLSGVLKGVRPRNSPLDILDPDMEVLGVQEGGSKGGCKSVIRSNADSRKSFMEANAERYMKKSRSAR